MAQLNREICGGYVRSRVTALVLGFVFLLTASTSFTQTITAALQGRVADKTGAVVPNATVTAVNTETGFTRSAKANAGGSYEITQLPVGTYKVTGEAATFQPQTSTLQLSIVETA